MIGGRTGGLTDAATVLAAWEASAQAPPAARGAALISAAGLVHDQEAALDLPLGDCAALALGAFVASFGPVADCAAECPGCAESLELPVDLRALPTAAGAVETVRVAGGRALAVRAPTVRELLAAAEHDDPRRSLLAACLRPLEPAVSTAGAAAPDEHMLDAEAEAAVDAAAERLAGAAAVVLVTTCPGCGAEVRVGLDPGELLWEAVSDAAERLLGEIATLAAAFGWTEPDVLALPPGRRAAYLAMAGR
jgi:hypothetical protein